MLTPSVSDSDTDEPSLAKSLAWGHRATWPVNGIHQTRRIRLVDLFCGCGAMTLGAWEAARRSGYGLDIRFALDWSRKPLEVFQHNFGCSTDVVVDADVSSLLGDVGLPLSVREQQLKQAVGRLDLLVAGPPCQGHSDLNNSSRRADPRNRLYLKVVRAAELLRPKTILIENVPAVVHDRHGVVDRAVTLLDSFGYHVDQAVVSMLKVGVPQQRKRHLLIASRRCHFSIREFIENLNAIEPTAGMFLSGLEAEPDQFKAAFYQPSRPTAENAKRIRYLFDNDIHDLPNSLRPSCHRDKQHAYISMYGRMHWDKPAQTLTSGFGSMGQGRFVHPTRPRLITPHEAARLQGFPDFFDFTIVDSVTALREMIANAVPPPLTLAFVAEFIRRKLV